MTEQDDLEKRMNDLHDEISATPTKETIQEYESRIASLEKKVKRESKMEPSFFSKNKKVMGKLFDIGTYVVGTAVLYYLFNQYNQSNPIEPGTIVAEIPTMQAIFRSSIFGYVSSAIVQQAIEIKDQITDGENKSHAYPLLPVVKSAVASIMQAIPAALLGLVGYYHSTEEGLAIGASIGALLGAYPSKILYDAWGNNA